MYKDCHVHTNISHDGIFKMEDYLNLASQKGVDEITFTEHYDIQVLPILLFFTIGNQVLLILMKYQNIKDELLLIQHSSTNLKSRHYLLVL